jgi:P27 family predicted phage terminase small subunit
MRATAGLDASGRRAWRYATGVLERLGERVELNVMPLEALARAVDERERARGAWVAVLDAGERVVAGSTGQPSPHPAWRMMREAEERVDALASELGLTPKARRDLRRPVTGRPPGAASAPDRVAVPRPTLRRVPPAA